MLGDYGSRFSRSTTSGYDVAQICLKGHWITGLYREMPQFNKKYCDECGAETITVCPKCQKDIRGSYTGSFTANNKAPAYCISCGAAYPWTSAKFDQAEELANLIDNLSDMDRRSLKSTFPDLIADTPKTQVAATKFGLIMQKVEPNFREAFKQIFYSEITDGAKHILKAFGIGF